MIGISFLRNPFFYGYVVGPEKVLVFFRVFPDGFVDFIHEDAKDPLFYILVLQEHGKEVPVLFQALDQGGIQVVEEGKFKVLFRIVHGGFFDDVRFHLSLCRI